MLPGPARTYVNMDNWDGYRDERSAIVAAIAERPTGNLVLTGDMHAFVWGLHPGHLRRQGFRRREADRLRGDYLGRHLD
ncbi:MAG: alkaline phosphatase D family protein [Actinomycetota bacterium]|nr:alkaline phosphatase D family protein [Actinomycetota bacterium]